VGDAIENSLPSFDIVPGQDPSALGALRVIEER
jgi:hypothetical protein